MTTEKFIEAEIVKGSDDEEILFEHLLANVRAINVNDKSRYLIDSVNDGIRDLMSVEEKFYEAFDIDDNVNELNDNKYLKLITLLTHYRFNLMVNGNNPEKLKEYVLKLCIELKTKFYNNVRELMEI